MNPLVACLQTLLAAQSARCDITNVFQVTASIGHLNFLKLNPFERSDRETAFHIARVKRQIEARPDADFKDATIGGRTMRLRISGQILLPSSQRHYVVARRTS